MRFHLFNVASMTKAGPLLVGAAFLALTVTAQAALGIWTLLAVVPLPLALMHQAMAMVTLTFAVIHAARVTPRHAPLTPRPVPGRDRR
jgi:cytochrome c oxidase assembly protein subunit 15